MAAAPEPAVSDIYLDRIAALEEVAVNLTEALVRVATGDGVSTQEKAEALAARILEPLGLSIQFVDEPDETEDTPE